MKSALIGYTGFVGGNLAAQAEFTDGYNSKNIEDIQGKTYNLLVSAGTKSEVWKANQNPQEDWEGIKKLLDNLERVKAKHFILISTVLVYPTPVDVDENTPIDASHLTQPYGKHRYQMEKFVLSQFPKTTIIRLPHLFGPGLKKNFVYDLIYDNALDFTHKDTNFQWYNLKNLWKDIAIATTHSIPLVNFATEPSTARELAQYARGIDFDNVTDREPLKFDFHTKYGALYDSSSHYLYHKKELFDQLKDFILAERKRARK